MGLLAAGLFVTVLASLYVRSAVEAAGQRETDFALVPIGGTIISLLMFGLALSVFGTRASARRMAERLTAELSASEEQLASAVEGSGAGLWDWQVQSGGAVFNERWAEIVGYTLAELAPTSIETWRSLTHPEDLQRADELLEAHFAGHLDIYACETRVRHKDGHWVWVLDRGKVSQWGSDGRPLRMTGTELDITERKQAEEALRHSEERHRAMFEKNGAIKLVVDPETAAIVDANPAACEFYGYSLDELLTRKIMDISTASMAEVTAVTARIAGEHVTDFIFQHRLASGELRDVEVNSGPFEIGGRTLLFSIIHDVTERRQAEEALQRSERSLQSALDGLGSSIVVLDDEGTILLANHTWREFAEQNGVAPGSVCEGANYLQVCDAAAEEHAEEAAPFAAGIRAVLCGEAESYSLEYPCDAPDKERWFIGRVTVFPSEGPPRVVVAHEDITARKQAQEALRDATDRLALATRAGGVGVWDYDPVNDTLTWDDQMFALYGTTREQFSGAYEAWQAGLHPDDKERGDAEIQMALRGEKEFDTELCVLWPDGTERIIRALALVQRDASGRGTHMVGTNWDITSAKRAEERIQRRNQTLVDLNDELVAETAALAEANATITKIAATDVLTGLANRRHFYEVLAKAISLARRHGSSLSLVGLDLDGLKRVNDTLGHEAGDEVLVSFAALLGALCRAEDLPARLGGDEFSVLLPGIDLDGARGLAERVLAAVRSCAALERRDVTVSAGVTQWTPGELTDDLLRRADEALYTVKRGGGDAVAGGG